MDEKQLCVGIMIRLGDKYCAEFCREPGVKTLVDGIFECDNGLYDYQQHCPSVWSEELCEYESIYDLFGDDLEYFMDCEVIGRVDIVSTEIGSDDKLKMIL